LAEQQFNMYVADIPWGVKIVATTHDTGDLEIACGKSMNNEEKAR
jgi:hypothetical protein